MALGSFTIIIRNIQNLSVDWWSLLFVLSALFNTICAYGIKKIQNQYAIGSYQIAYYNNIVSLILYLIMTILFQETCLIYEVGKMNIMPLVLCVLCKATLMLTYYESLNQFQVWIVKVILLIVPVFTLIIQVFFVKETITLFQTAGIIITLVCGFLMIEKKDNKSRD